MKKIYFFLLLPLLVLGLIVSLHLTRIHYPLMAGASKGFSFCQSGCDRVNGSRFSEFLGIPLSSYGAILYALLLFSALFGFLFRKAYGEFSLSVIALFSALAVAIDGFLLYLSLVKLKSFCGLCGLTYLINLNCLLVSLWGLLRSPGQILSILGREIRKIFSFKDALEKSPGRYYERVVSFLFFLILVFVGGSGWALSYVYDLKYRDVNATPERLRQFQEQYERLPRVQIDLQGAPSLGPKEAPLTIVDFSDFKCPHCKHAANVLTRLIGEYGGQVRFVFKQFPNDPACNPNIPSGRPSSGSCLLAKAALCAHAQGHFWPYHDVLFATQEETYTPEKLISLAQKLGLAKESFSVCLQNPNTETLLRSDMTQGLGLGVQGTPTLFFNGKMVRGNPPLELMRVLIEKEVKKR